MDEATRSDLIRRYREGPDVLEAALAELAEADYDRSVEGWTPRQVVHHVADSELTSAVRLRRLLAEEKPVIAGYDEELFARRLHYANRPIESSLIAIRGARTSSADLLAAIDEAEWGREGTHSESGRYTVEDWLRIYAAHCHDHAEQIRRSRRG